MCDYQGYEFGANYPDSICIDGRLYDADNCDNEGNLYEPAEDVPCPMCRRDDAIAWWTRRFDDSENEAAMSAVCLVDDIRKNRENGTEPWKKVQRETR